MGGRIDRFLKNAGAEEWMRGGEERGVGPIFRFWRSARSLVSLDRAGVEMVPVAAAWPIFGHPTGRKES